MAKAATMSPLDRIRQIDEERRQIMAEAKGEAMEAVKVAIDNLNSLGFNYRITESAFAGRANGSRIGTRQINANRACPICGFQTNPPHDARAHRSQGEDKHAFTAGELEARGMTVA